MKKTLAAVAVLGAFAGSALAADVTLYGMVDTDLNWTQTKTTGSSAKDTFNMASGQNTASRIGFRGTEDLGDGWKVGFNLENAFASDTGALDKSGRFFQREALLFVQSPFGELSMGRVGALDSGAGRYAMMGSAATAMSTGWDLVGKSTKIFLGTGDRMDNTVTYATPTFAGVTVYAQASLKADTVESGVDAAVKKAHVEGSSDADRYYGLGAKFSAEGLNAGLAVSMRDYSRYDMDQKDDDGYTVSGYVNYDFGMVKPMLAAQYWDGGKVGTYASTTNSISSTKGYGVMVGATAPVLGGTFKVTGGWNDYEAVDTDNVDGNNWVFGMGYEYKLSKRTMVYTAAGYMEEKVKHTGVSTKTKTSEVMAGLVHNF